MTGERVDHIADVSKTDLLRVIVALAGEVYALADQLDALREALAARGIDLSALDAPREPAAHDAEARARRDAFVSRVFGALTKHP